MLKRNKPKPINFGYTHNFDSGTLKQCEDRLTVETLQKLDPITQGCFDVRTHVVELDIKPGVTFENSGVDWYYNYLRLNLIYSYNNADAPLNQLLRLGYIPVCFLPTYLSTLNHIWFTSRLNKLEIPYTQQTARGFTYAKMRMTSFDVWVSKMVMAEKLGKEPHKITSKDVMEVLLNA